MSKSCHPLSLYKQLLLQLVNNYNIRTELRFLNRTEPNLFQSEFEFLKTELQLNQNKKKSVLHIPGEIVIFYRQQHVSLAVWTVCSLSNAASSTWSSRLMPVMCLNSTRMRNAWKQKAPFSWTLLLMFGRFVAVVCLFLNQFVQFFTVVFYRLASDCFSVLPDNDE